MSDNNFAAGPYPFSDAESTHDAVIFCAAVNDSYARFLNECTIFDNETLHVVGDENDYPCDAFVNETSSAPVLFVEIGKNLVAHE
jgi:hypothetical protein